MAEFDPDAPLRLHVAARVAFPDGSMKASGLMTEARKGRLDVSCVAGRYYTTLNAVKRMLELCLVPRSLHASGSSTDRAASPRGSSLTVDASTQLDVLRQTVLARKQRSQRTLRASKPPAGQKPILLAFPSSQS